MSAAYPSSKILNREDARQRADDLKRAGRRLVTVNGAFDLLHAGHVAILQEARSQGDALFVGVNSDASIRQVKGPLRPIMPETERAELLAALACVDVVVLIQDREAGRAIIELVRPTVHVNGSEYGQPDAWAEYPWMVKHGVTGYVCTRRPAYATTEIIRKIQSLRECD